MTTDLKDFELPKTYEHKGSLYIYAPSWGEPRINFTSLSKDTEFFDDLEYIFLEEVVLEIPLRTKGTIDLRTGMVEKLKAKRTELVASQFMELKAVDDQIESLLAIEHKGGES